jgi:hypothetical protein
MNQTVKRGLALLMAFVLFFSLMPVFELKADAATVDYVKDDNYNYIYNYIYNHIYKYIYNYNYSCSCNHN